MCLFVTTKTHQFCWQHTESCTLTQTPPPRHRHHAPSDKRWVKGRACGGAGLTRLGWREGNVLVAMKKKVKYHGLVHRATHDFYMKINPRQKLCDAVACASVAPMRLHHPIRHAGINKQLIIARQRRNGGGRSYYIIGIWVQLADVSRFGDYF